MERYIKRRLGFGLLLTAGLFLLLFFVVEQGSIPVAAPLEEDGVRLPIVMYHSLLRDLTRGGDWVLSPAVFEADLRWLLERGYTPVLIRDVIGYVKGENDLPQKPVVLTFDDGFLNNKNYLLPLLENYDFCFTLSVVGEYTELYTAAPDPNPSYAYLTWEDVAALALDPRIEIVNHSYASHTMPPANASKARLERYKTMQAEDAARMNAVLSEKCGVRTAVYTYPFGFAVKGTDDELKKLGFEATLMCSEHINAIRQGDPDCLFSLGRYNRPAGISTDDFMKAMLGEESR